MLGTNAPPVMELLEPEPRLFGKVKDMGWTSLNEMPGAWTAGAEQGQRHICFANGCRPSIRRSLHREIIIFPFHIFDL